MIALCALWFKSLLGLFFPARAPGLDCIEFSGREGLRDWLRVTVFATRFNNKRGTF